MYLDSSLTPPARTHENRGEPNRKADGKKQCRQNAGDQIRQPAVMLPDKLQDAQPQLHNHSYRSLGRTLTAKMNDLASRGKQYFPSAFPESIAPVGFFGVHEKPLVHHANLINCLSPDKHETSRYNLYLAYIASVPPGHSLTPKEPALRKELIEISAGQKHVQYRREHKTRRLQRSVRVQYPTPRHARPRMSIREANSLGYSAVQNHGVTIEQKHISTFGDRHPLIIRRGKAFVPGILEQDDPLEVTLYHFHRIIG
jgi:hypothetical protein